MEEHTSEVVPREFLCCPLCKEEYQDPKYLPCLHSFCKACIDDHISTTSYRAGRFECPVCATEMVIPEDGEESPTLPDNTFARRLSCPMAIQGKREKKCRQCESAGVRADATTHCINCDEFLCGTCSLSHLEQVETASHKTQKAEDYKASDADTTAEQLTPALSHCCEYYDALDIGSMYCVDCELSLCAECHSIAHRGHRCAELSAISENFASKIRDPLQELKKDKQTLERALVTLGRVRENISKKQLTLRSSVKQRTKLLCNLIKDYESILCLEIEKRHGQNLTAIHEREDAIQRHIESIKAVTALTETLLTFGSEEEKVSMRRTIGRRVRELCEEDLPTNHVQLRKFMLSEPVVSVENICEMYGELKRETTKEGRNKKAILTSQSIDLGMMSKRDARHSVSSIDGLPTELTDLEEFEEDDNVDALSASSDAPRPTSSMLSGSGTDSEDMKIGDMPSLSPRHLDVQEASHSDSSAQSSMIQENVPCHNLEVAKRELRLPDALACDCIKGIGVNPHGDIIIGTVSPGEKSKIFILEKRGIIRGQIPVDKNWGIHSIAADGRVSLVVPRGDNKYKIRVMSGENSTKILADAHIESFGLNAVTATNAGNLLVTANRYAATNPILGRSSKSGGNIAMYDQDGKVKRVITNKTFAELHPYLFDRPQSIAVDQQGNFFVMDPGRHSIIGFRPDGEFLFEYGNTDAEEIYQGPDIICSDSDANLIVMDKKNGRIDILNYEGHLQRSYFLSEHIRFVCAAPEGNLMLVNSEGIMKFYDYR